MKRFIEGEAQRNLELQAGVHNLDGYARYRDFVSAYLSPLTAKLITRPAIFLGSLFIPLQWVAGA